MSRDRFSRVVEYTRRNLLNWNVLGAYLGLLIVAHLLAISLPPLTRTYLYYAGTLTGCRTLTCIPLLWGIALVLLYPLSLRLAPVVQRLRS